MSYRLTQLVQNLMFYYCIILTSATCFGTFFGHHQAINQGLRVTQYLHYDLTLHVPIGSQFPNTRSRIMTLDIIVMLDHNVNTV